MTFTMKPPDFPTIMQIEVNNFCNARCIMCPVPRMKRKHEIMDFALFEKVINKIKIEKKDFSGWILPFMSGEPFLVPDYVDYLRLIRKRIPNAKIAVDTNASVLTFETAEKIIDEELLDLLTISFDGGTKEAYESVRKGLSFEKVQHNIRSLLYLKATKKKRRPLVNIKMILTPETFSSKEYFRLIFKEADRLTFSVIHNWGGQIGLVNPLVRSNFCSFLFQTFPIQTNGNVVLCCMDYEGHEILGNVCENSIREIWLGKEYQKRREYLDRRQFDKLPLCKNCSNLDRGLLVQQLAKIKTLLENRFPNYIYYNRVLFLERLRHFSEIFDKT